MLITGIQNSFHNTRITKNNNSTNQNNQINFKGFVENLPAIAKKQKTAQQLKEIIEKLLQGKDIALPERCALAKLFIFVQGVAENGTFKDCPDYFGYGAIRYAMDSKRPNILKLTAQIGGNINSMDNLGRTPLIVAKTNNDEQAVKILQQYGAENI